MLFELAVILTLVAVNGIFAGAEISVVSIRKSRLHQLVERGHAGARAAQALRDAPERFLATVQIGITVVGATAAAFSGASTATRLAHALEGLGWAAQTAEEVALAVTVAVLSGLSLVFGELVPKSLALRAGERYALLVARPLLALAQLFRPVVWLLTWSSNLVLKPFGDATSFTEARHSAEELRQLVEEAAQAGTLDPRSGEIASRALDFGGLTAASVMVPRQRIVAVPRNASQADLRKILLGTSFSRLPVHDGTLDGVVGYLTVREALASAWEKGEVALEALVRPAYFTPATTSAGRVLQELRRRRLPLAIVVDEHGGVAGLITLGDLVEELVGEVAAEEAWAERPVRVEPDGSALVRGTTAIRDVNRELGLKLPEAEGRITLAGLCISLAGGIPQRGTRLSSGDQSLEVVEASARAVDLVRIRPQPPAAPP